MPAGRGRPAQPFVRCSRTAQEIFVLGHAFALIEGHPAEGLEGNRLSQFELRYEGLRLA